MAMHMLFEMSNFLRISSGQIKCEGRESAVNPSAVVRAL